MKLKFALAATAATLILLCGCSGEASVQDAAPSPELTSYTVRYYDGETLMCEQRLLEGRSLSAPVETGSGLNILRWLDENGEETEPSLLSADGDACFYAVAAPEFDLHVPYLFTDEYGFLHPDEPFTSAQLEEALCALTGSEFGNAISISDESPALTAADMKAYLRSYFSDDELDTAFASADNGQELCRADAAVFLNVLLGRAADSEPVPDDGASIIPDVHSGREDCAQLLEAAMPHSHSSSGTMDSAASLYEPGFLNVDGVLYYIGEDGYIVTDTEVCGIYLGSDGTYSSGNETLDGYVEQIVADIIASAPDAERIDWLRSAFNYARDSFTYLRKQAYTFGETGWEVNDAIVMLEGKLGNCYNYASVFWSLARGLGYNARAVSGTIASNPQPHGWVMIELDGVEYYCDPEIEMTYVRKGNYSNDMFMMNSYLASAWHYVM